MRLIRGDESIAGMKKPELFLVPAELGANQITSSITLNRTYLGKIWQVNSGSAVTLTVPPDTSSVSYIEGEAFTFFHRGAGTVALVQGSGVTVIGPGLNSSGQYTWLSIIRSDVLNEWLAINAAA